MKNVQQKTRILIPVVLALAMLFAFIFIIHLGMEKETHDDVATHLKSVNKLFERQIKTETELMSAEIQIIAGNKLIQDAWLAKDREVLLKRVSPILKMLDSQHKITHFYFHDLNQRNFLRVHKPDMHGDIIDRMTLKQAAKTNQFFSGVELGPLGTSTLRVVFPWVIENQLSGYIEMGEDTDVIIKKIREILGFELYLTIYKNFLNRQEWEKGMQMLGRKNKWDQLKSSVIVSQTIEEVPSAFKDLLTKGEHKYREVEEDLELNIRGRLYRVGFIPLYAVGNKEIGDIVVLNDVTKSVTRYHNIFLMIGAVCVVLALTLILIFTKGPTIYEVKDKKNVLLTPVRYSIIMALTLFFAEALLMSLFMVLPPFSPLTKIFIDSFFLVLLVSPAVYFLLFSPLMFNMAERLRSEHEKHKQKQEEAATKE